MHKKDKDRNTDDTNILQVGFGFILNTHLVGVSCKMISASRREHLIRIPHDIISYSISSYNRECWILKLTKAPQFCDKYSSYRNKFDEGAYDCLVIYLPHQKRERGNIYPVVMDDMLELLAFDLVPCVTAHYEVYKLTFNNTRVDPFCDHECHLKQWLYAAVKVIEARDVAELSINDSSGNAQYSVINACCVTYNNTLRICSSRKESTRVYQDAIKQQQAPLVPPPYKFIYMYKYQHSRYWVASYPKIVFPSGVYDRVVYGIYGDDTDHINSFALSPVLVKANYMLLGDKGPNDLLSDPIYEYITTKFVRTVPKLKDSSAKNRNGKSHWSLCMIDNKIVPHHPMISKQSGPVIDTIRARPVAIDMWLYIVLHEYDIIEGCDSDIDIKTGTMSHIAFILKIIKAITDDGKDSYTSMIMGPLIDTYVPPTVGMEPLRDELFYNTQKCVVHKLLIDLYKFGKLPLLTSRGRQYHILADVHGQIGVDEIVIPGWEANAQKAVCLTNLNDIMVLNVRYKDIYNDVNGAAFVHPSKAKNPAEVSIIILTNAKHVSDATDFIKNRRKLTPNDLELARATGITSNEKVIEFCIRVMSLRYLPERQVQMENKDLNWVSSLESILIIVEFISFLQTGKWVPKKIRMYQDGRIETVRVSSKIKLTDENNIYPQWVNEETCQSQNINTYFDQMIHVIRSAVTATDESRAPVIVRDSLVLENYVAEDIYNEYKDILEDPDFGSVVKTAVEDMVSGFLVELYHCQYGQTGTHANFIEILTTIAVKSSLYDVGATWDRPLALITLAKLRDYQLSIVDTHLDNLVSHLTRLIYIEDPNKARIITAVLMNYYLQITRIDLDEIRISELGYATPWKWLMWFKYSSHLRIPEMMRHHNKTLRTALLSNSTAMMKAGSRGLKSILSTHIRIVANAAAKCVLTESIAGGKQSVKDEDEVMQAVQDYIVANKRLDEDFKPEEASEIWSTAIYELSLLGLHSENNIFVCTWGALFCVISLNVFLTCDLNYTNVEKVGRARSKMRMLIEYESVRDKAREQLQNWEPLLIKLDERDVKNALRGTQYLGFRNYIAVYGSVCDTLLLDSMLWNILREATHNLSNAESKVENVGNR